MARIELQPPRTLLYRAGEWYSRRKYGAVLDPGKIYAYNNKVLLALVGLERRVERWNKLDPALKHLAVMACSAQIGCSWCIDFGYWEADRLGLPMEKVRLVPTWREHREAFSELEQLVLEYSEAATATPPQVSDELTNALLKYLSMAELVELTTMVAVENLRSRVNSAFGLKGQGFSDQCQIRSVS